MIENIASQNLHKVGYEKRLAGFIYVVSATGTEFYKIGYTTSSDPASRMRDFRTGSPYDLSLIAVYPTGDVILTEQRIHSTLQERYVRGEWFDLDDQWFNVAMRAIATFSTSLSPKDLKVPSSARNESAVASPSCIDNLISHDEKKGAKIKKQERQNRKFDAVTKKQWGALIKRKNQVLAQVDGIGNEERDLIPREVSSFVEAVRVLVESFEEVDLLIAPPPNGTIPQIIEYVEEMTGQTVSKGYVSKVLAKFREEEKGRYR